jgi:hypothetical protein
VDLETYNKKWSRTEERPQKPRVVKIPIKPQKPFSSANSKHNGVC